MTLEEFRTRFTSFDTHPLARGGQKEVYGAVHPDYGSVVVKVLFKTDARSEREIALIDKHQFASVPRIHDVRRIEINGEVKTVVVEERVSGRNLREVIANGERYDLYAAVDFLSQILGILDQVWAKRIVHRDIKPDNIMLRDGGDVVLLDFGIARALDEESITATSEMGPFTPGYAAPEVFMLGKDAIDARADIYSVGVVTYELVTGKNPYREHAHSIMQVLYNTTTITPVRCVIEGDKQSQFSGLISSMMSQDRFARPRDAREALGWLEAAKKTFG